MRVDIAVTRAARRPGPERVRFTITSVWRECTFRLHDAFPVRCSFMRSRLDLRVLNAGSIVFVFI